MTRLLLLGVLAALAAPLASGCDSGGSSGALRAAASPRTLTDLRSVSQLQDAFNSASAEPRLIVLVSPT